MRRLEFTIATALILVSSTLWGQRAGAESLVCQTPASNQAAAEADLPRDAVRSPKQKLLDDQAQRLVTMARELKTAVDKTNKNILSLDVVRKAEEIELLAHRMKEQEKK